MSSDKNQNLLYEGLKRVMDLFLATLLLILFSPVMIVVAIIIKLTSPGPVLVEKSNSHMKRVGKDEKTFRIYKFRSMMEKADILEKTDPRFRHVYEEKHKDGSYKPRNDTRITPIGKFIRKYSIDEMPQFFNVLQGDMSIVGPRPYLKEELDEQTAKFPGTEKYVSEVHTVKPGITGFWQVSGRSDVAFDKRIELDAYYARKKSIWLDILVLLKTPFAMLTGKGAR